MAGRRGLVIRFFRVVLLLAILLVGSALAYVWYLGAWNLVFPSSAHDSIPPALPSDLASPALLVFSKTNAFRHRESIEAGGRFLAALAGDRDWGYFHTENGAVFNSADLQRVDVVVFLNTTGDTLDERQERAFQDWLRSGGGWFGIHAAGDSSHTDWSWYMDELIGVLFTAHIMGPQFQRATVVLENQGHPVLRGLQDVWEHEEEWYSWAHNPRERGFTVLATVDEDSYTPEQRMLGKVRDLSMGDHPVAWSRCIDDGRSLYMAMGHRADAFEHPQIIRLVENGLSWLSGARDGGC
jgi:type 1 glutamine amidotransferase